MQAAATPVGVEEATLVVKPMRSRPPLVKLLKVLGPWGVVDGRWIGRCVGRDRRGEEGLGDEPAERLCMEAVDRAIFEGIGKAEAEGVTDPKPEIRKRRPRKNVDSLVGMSPVHPVPLPDSRG